MMTLSLEEANHLSRSMKKYIRKQIDPTGGTRVEDEQSKCPGQGTQAVGGNTERSNTWASNILLEAL